MSKPKFYMMILIQLLISVLSFDYGFESKDLTESSEILRNFTDPHSSMDAELNLNYINETIK